MPNRSYSALLEPEVLDTSPTLHTADQVIALSQAISTRRIADALTQIAKDTHLAANTVLPIIGGHLAELASTVSDQHPETGAKISPYIRHRSIR